MTTPYVDARVAVTNLARWLVWVRETGGSNRGEMVERMQQTVGLLPGTPWCAAFVAACGRGVLGRSWPLPLVGGCASLRDYADGRKVLRGLPEFGAVFLQWHESKGRHAHTGFVLQPLAGGWATVEGNTNDTGAREGDGVYLRHRTWGPKDRFIPWWELWETTPPQGVTLV